MNWIYGSVFSSVPGYQKLTLDGTTYTTIQSVQPRDFWQLLDDVSTMISADGWSIDVSESTFTIAGATPAILSWPDRLGWLLGYDAEPGDVEPGDALTEFAPRAVSPACIPLESCEREPMTRQQERETVIDRFGRGHGNAFGGADLWRFRCIVDRDAFVALRSGWCVSGGPVVISPFTLEEHLAGTATAWSSTNPLGYHRGRIIGVDGGWPDASGPHSHFEFDLIVVSEVP